MVRGFVGLFSVGFVLFCAAVYYSGRTGDMVYVKSLVDSHEYLVRNVPDRQDAADMLAGLRARLLRVVELAVSARAGVDEFCARTIDQLRSRFDPDVMSETPPDSDATSYSVDKGRKVFFCLRSKPEGVLLDVNTLTYVGIHELSHIASHTYGHDEVFWSNFKWFLRLAVANGVYDFQDFEAAPQRYCGMTISSQAYTPGVDDADTSALANLTRSCR